MKIENIEVYGFKASLRGMRNPLDSWSKSDTTYWDCDGIANWDSWRFNDQRITAIEFPEIGPNDLKLAQKLIKGGTEHRKFLRQIQIWMDITIPRYVWQELDTYKVATVRNSCSTMHKLGHTDLDFDDFERALVMPSTLAELNKLGKEYRETKDYDLVRAMKALLPESFLQKATYSMNYETALSMYKQRRNHRLPEWNTKNPHSICSMIASLPYMKELVPEVFE